MNYKTFFRYAKEKCINNIQITEKQTIESNIEIINGKIDSFDDGNNISYSIKAQVQGKTVKTTSNYLDKDIINLLILKAKKTDSKYEDDYLENKRNIIKNKPINFDISNEIKILKKLDDIRKEYPSVEKMTTYFSESYTNTRIINSNDVDISTDSHLCSFIVEVIAKKDNDFTSYDKKVLEIDKKKINFEEVVRDVIEKVLLQSNKKKLETNKYTVLLDSNVSGRIIASLINMISGTSIRNKISCLNNKLDKKIFSDKLTIIEDPRNKKYPGYRLFDDEGTDTKKKIIVDKGKLKTFIYDIKEAKIKNIKPTGNSYQTISTRNMYVLPGNKSDQELIKSIKKGLYIVDYMGSMGSAINTVNGSISLQVFGFIIENGKIISGINPVVMTTTIFELLTNIEEIGSELKFINSNCASPAMIIKNISIAS